VRHLFAFAVLGIVVVLIACSNDSGDSGDTGPSATCDDISGPCAPQCIPYALCTSEGSSCVIGGASCGHYWICHDATWTSDTSHDCDSGEGPSDAAPDVAVDATVDAPVDSSVADSNVVDAPPEADAPGDDGSDDGATPDGDDAG
jgi:hypothetical protein